MSNHDWDQPCSRSVWAKVEADPETRMVFQGKLIRDLAAKLRRLGEDYLQQPPSPPG